MQFLDSALMRGMIRSLERGLLQWRIWAGAQRKWQGWAAELARRRRSAQVHDCLQGRTKLMLTPHPLHREWADGAAMRWDVASSGFAAELREAASKASLEYKAVQDARRRQSSCLGLGEHPCAGDNDEGSLYSSVLNS